MIDGTVNRGVPSPAMSNLDVRLMVFGSILRVDTDTATGRVWACRDWRALGVDEAYQQALAEVQSQTHQGSAPPMIESLRDETERVLRHE